VKVLLAAGLAVLALACAEQRGGSGMSTTTTTIPCPHSPPITQPVMLTLSGPKQIDSYPQYPKVCPGDTVEWTAQHKCPTCSKKVVNLKIGTRHEFTNPTGPEHDFLKKNWVLFGTCKPKGVIKLNDPPTVIGQCEVMAGAQNGCYKYEIEGDNALDPEAEVQGGVSGEPMPPCPSPAPVTNR
jgi:hypothetical protein